MKERPILFSAPMVRAILAGNKTQTRRVLKNQPYISSSNPPRFRDTEPGDIFVCPDFWPTNNNNLGRVLVECTSIGCYHCMGQQEFAAKHSPYGIPGDRLWVRETFAQGFEYDAVKDRLRQFDDDGNELPKKTWYRATDSISWSDDAGWETNVPWKPSIHMPRSACRILLEITGVRVERLQDGEGEAAWESRYLAEGIHKIDHGRGDHYFSAFRTEPHPKNWADPFDAWRELWGCTGGDWDANPWVWVIEFRRVK